MAMRLDRKDHRMAERLTARERLEHMKQLVKEQHAAMQQRLRSARSAADDEARREHAKHLRVLAKLLDETGLSGYEADTLRPWFKDLAVRIEQGANSLPGF
jgi:predicted  nucleic acid-binding Zn-ribbon protein